LKLKHERHLRDKFTSTPGPRYIPLHIVALVSVDARQVLTFPSTWVDVRDVATGHVNALEGLPGLHGQRFLLTGDTPCMPGGALDLSQVAAACFPEADFSGVTPKYSSSAMAFARAASYLPLIGDRVMTEVGLNDDDPGRKNKEPNCLCLSRVAWNCVCLP
jgi:hypothetical protein